MDCFCWSWPANSISGDTTFIYVWAYTLPESSIRRAMYSPLPTMTCGWNDASDWTLMLPSGIFSTSVSLTSYMLRNMSGWAATGSIRCAFILVGSPVTLYDITCPLCSATSEFLVVDSARSRMVSRTGLSDTNGYPMRSTFIVAFGGLNVLVKKYRLPEYCVWFSNTYVFGSPSDFIHGVSKTIVAMSSAATVALSHPESSV